MNTTELTLGQAAQQVGCSKATLSKALKNGDLSHEKRDDGSFAIQPAELMRWDSERSRKNVKNRSQTPDKTPKTPPETSSAMNIALETLQAELTRTRADTKEERERLLAMIEDYRARLDRAEARADRLLPAPEQATTPPEKPRGLLRRLFG